MIDLSGIAVSQQPWINLSDVEIKKIYLWNELFNRTGIKTDTAKLPVRIGKLQRQELVKKEQLLVSIMQEEVSPLKKTMSGLYLIILTNQDGAVLDIMGPDTIISYLESVNVGIGTSFCLEHAGINGISMAMQMDSLVAVKGFEHSLKIFEKWNCICSPIKHKDQNRGYLEISVSITDDVKLIVPLLERIVTDIEFSIQLADPGMKKAKIYEHFDQYGLTNREKEIGFGWLHNESAIHISLCLGISEATVRHTLKKIYSKTKCYDKGGFIRKFMK